MHFNADALALNIYCNYTEIMSQILFEGFKQEISHSLQKYCSTDNPEP